MSDIVDLGKRLCLGRRTLLNVPTSRQDSSCRVAHFHVEMSSANEKNVFFSSPREISVRFSERNKIRSPIESTVCATVTVIFGSASGSAGLETDAPRKEMDHSRRRR